MKKFPTPTGFGFDSHAFGKKGPLFLGGIKIPGFPVLKGHSDGDALLHAVIDALLGAASLGDIGEHFPDTSRATQGISSGIMLQKTLLLILKAGYQPAHIDVTVVADRPRLQPYKRQMILEVSRLLEVSPQAVNIKGKTSEGLTLFTKGGGIAVWAVATLEPGKKR